MEEGVLVYEGEIPKIDTLDRFEICNQCPLYIKDVKICNPNLWMNPNNYEVSHTAKAGFVKGCGCLISRKARQPNSHCHLGKW